VVKITVLYPNIAGKRFDVEYYLKVHMPLSIEKQGLTLKGVQVETGLSGAAVDAPPPFVAICHFLYDTLDDFLAAFLPHAEELQGDMTNYTDIEPLIQVSQVQNLVKK
jgi:uncharacterized protein (TIGR02118 family)